MNDNSQDMHKWSNMIDSGSRKAWSGYAFEQVCLLHLPQIKKRLGIDTISTDICSWQNEKAQIDLVIDRRDRIINLCEMKYSRGAFRIDKSYAAELRNKISVYEATEHTRKALHLTMIASNGLAPNEYSGLIQSTLTLDALFGQ